MTAPGQEPDEVMTTQPEGDAKPAERPGDKVDLDAIGDNHMPDDLREAVANEHADAPADRD